jgi:hypothetical protein
MRYGIPSPENDVSDATTSLTLAFAAMFQSPYFLTLL